MRKIQMLFGAAASAVVIVAGINVSPVSAASQGPLTMAAWQAEIGQVSTVGSGCFQAAFPALVWHAATCVTAPERPLAPAISTSRSGSPDAVGNGFDYSAEVSGKITRATGTFTGVSAKISETGKVNNSGSAKPNEFSLQLNTEFFSGSPACKKASVPADCQAWQQFVYATDTNDVFMQYWLIDYNTTCPSGWFTSAGGGFIDCYTNSSASTLSGGALTAKSLATLSLSGSAKSGGNDQVQLVSGGHATMATGKDSKVALAPHWNTTEWGVYGDGGRGVANFGASNTLEAVTKLKATSSSAPTCIEEGFTGETNNLTLAATPALGSESSPTMASKQTDGAAGTASCAVKA
jgi:hypothetical protein